MISQPLYPAAAAAAARIHPHFAERFATTVVPKSQLATLPPQEVVAFMLDAAFWASLRREEGFSPTISLAFVSLEQVRYPMVFERSIALSPQPLTRLAPAVERPGIHLAVWPEDGELRVWGATRNLPPLCFVLEVVGPGLLVAKRSRASQSGKFVNVAVIQGDELKIIDERSATLPDCPGLLISLLGLEAPFASNGNINVLIQLAVSVREHGRGGTLLVVPDGTPTWRESILHPMLYAISPTFSGLAKLMQNKPEGSPSRTWQDALERVVDAIGGLTAVDGATLITDSYELLAFGTKIVRRPGWQQVTQVIVTEPIEGAEPQIADPTLLGGTRHLSAAQFVHDQRDAIAMVASQDGRFTVFAWSGCEDMVHAHRIDTLLL